MASPPHRLGAHDRVTPPFMSQRAQPSETAMERMAQRVVGLIVTMGQMVRGCSDVTFAGPIIQPIQ